MREIESDGFITRDEDLRIKHIERLPNNRAKPMEDCAFPRCEECNCYHGQYCTVPMVVTKQLYLFVADRLTTLESQLTELETLVYDEILGDGGDEAKLVSFKPSKELCKNPRVEIKK